jgi:hypothetical protein
MCSRTRLTATQIHPNEDHPSVRPGCTRRTGLWTLDSLQHCSDWSNSVGRVPWRAGDRWRPRKPTGGAAPDLVSASSPSLPLPYTIAHVAALFQRCRRSVVAAVPARRRGGSADLARPRTRPRGGVLVLLPSQHPRPRGSGRKAPGRQRFRSEASGRLGSGLDCTCKARHRLHGTSGVRVGLSRNGRQQALGVRTAGVARRESIRCERAT